MNKSDRIHRETDEFLIEKIDDVKLIKESIMKLLPMVDRSIINLAYFKGFSHSQINSPREQ